MNSALHPWFGSFDQHDRASLRRISVHAIERLDIFGVRAIAGLSLFVRRSGFRGNFLRQRRRADSHAHTGRYSPKEIASSNLAFLPFHRGCSDLSDQADT
jgi:hypothetical protein